MDFEVEILISKVARLEQENESLWRAVQATESSYWELLARVQKLEKLAPIDDEGYFNG